MSIQPIPCALSLLLAAGPPFPGADTLIGSAGGILRSWLGPGARQ